jgi:glycosyltransferase involved in cell wall biosynthesis
MRADVSVMVATYNRADLLGETLQAIVRQTRPPAEVVVIDDGSRDHTAEVVRAFGPAVRYVRTENGGISAARNAGVRECRAEWVAFCDDDDVWRPHYLERMTAAAGVNADVRVVFADFVHIRDGRWESASKFAAAPAGYWDGSADERGGVRVFHDSMYRRLLTFQPVFPTCTLVRRDHYWAVGGYDGAFGRVGSVDWEFTLRAVERPPVAAVFEPLAGVRKHAGNFSAGYLFTVEGELAILRHALAAHRSGVEHRRLILDQIGERSWKAAEAAFEAGEFGKVYAHARAGGPAWRPRWGRLKAALAFAPPLARLAKRVARHFRATGRGRATTAS